MKKWLIRIGIGIGVGLLCIAAVVVLLHIRGKILLEKKIVELKTQGLPTSFAELEAKYKLPEGTPNAADIYMKAFAAYKPLPDEEKQEMLFNMGYLKYPMDKEPYSQEELAASAEFIGLNQEMLNLLHQAGQIKECAYPLTVSDGHFSLGDAYDGIKNARQTLYTVTMHYIEINQPEKAFGSIIDQLRLADSMSRCNFLIGLLLQIGVVEDNMPNILRFLNRFNCTDAQLLEIKVVLEQSEKMIGLDSAMEGEICAYIHYGQNPSSEAFSLSEDMTAGIRIVGMFTNNIVELIELHQRVLTIQQASMEKQNELCEALDTEICNLNYLHMLTVILSPLLGGCYQEYIQVKSETSFVIMALAVERYRLKENKLPQAVDVLVPEYLPQVYMDPFDGKPLRYKLTNPGYMIYSVGENGVDDGGLESDPNDPGKMLDHVFCVYR